VYGFAPKFFLMINPPYYDSVVDFKIVPNSFIPR